MPRPQLPVCFGFTIVQRVRFCTNSAIVLTFFGDVDYERLASERKIQMVGLPHKNCSAILECWEN